jgi:predicted glycosyltransferase
MKTILFQPANGIGLGHQSRLLAIGQALTAAYSAVRVLYAVDTSRTELLEAEQVPVMHIPKATADVPWRGWSSSERTACQFAVVEAALNAANPDIILFDGWPNEIMARLAISQKRRIAICVREVSRVREYQERHRPVLNAATAIIVPDYGPTVAGWDFSEKTHHVGEICRQTVAAASVRPSGAEVLITAGGGGFPGTVLFYNWTLAVLDALPIQVRAEMHVVLVTGPLFEEWSQLRIRSPISLVRFEPNLTNRLASARLIVAQGGYNTLAELSTCGVPTVCVPAKRNWDDQAARASKKSAAFPWIRVATMGADDELAAAVMSGLEGTNRPVLSGAANYPDGALRAAHLLMNVVNGN